MKVFSKQSIFSLVDILFKDMKEDYKLIETEEIDEDEEEEKKIEEDQESENGSVDPTKYGLEIEDYMSLKGVLAIERIKDIVGEIMNTCAKSMRYEILSKIMRGVIFEQKRLRESFM
jgi:hypothetical protein